MVALKKFYAYKKYLSIIIFLATPGLGARGRGKPYGDYMPGPSRGRGGGYGGRGGATFGAYQYPAYGGAGYPPPHYDPYYPGYAGYGGGYDMYGGGYPHPDPYYAPQPAPYGGPMRGGVSQDGNN